VRISAGNSTPLCQEGRCGWAGLLHLPRRIGASRSCYVDFQGRCRAAVASRTQQHAAPRAKRKEEVTHREGGEQRGKPPSTGSLNGPDGPARPRHVASIVGSRQSRVKSSPVGGESTTALLNFYTITCQSVAAVDLRPVGVLPGTAQLANPS
jgi:hypothetical protein